MSGLTRYQTALAAALGAAASGGADQAALAGMSEQGIAVTGRVRRSWCIGRARQAAPLTLSALPEAQREELLTRWVDAGGGTNSFFETESEALLAFLAERIEPDSDAMALCRFERAVIRARTAGPSAPSTELDAAVTLERSPDADIVTLDAPIDALLAAIDGTGPWPAPRTDPQHLLIAPGVDGLVRPADAREMAVWRAAELGVCAGLPGARELFACGALRVRS